MLKFGLPLLIFIGLALLLAFGLRLDPKAIPSPLLNQAAPVFSLPTVADSNRRLSPADYSGQVWLLNVWASWCVSCREEHPLLMQLVKDSTVVLVGLNYKDEPNASQNWLAQHGNPYVASAMDREGRVGIDYGVYGVPETFVIDKKGIVRHKHTGPITLEQWQQQLRPLILQLQAETA
jgi:cytochrome c biogenesis protein CcmG/thiol:disulfide interchange protein DsbE